MDYYFLRKAKQGLFWCPGGRGYTNDPSQAGVYDAGHPLVIKALREQQENDADPDSPWDVHTEPVHIQSVLAQVDADLAVLQNLRRGLVELVACTQCAQKE